MDPEILDAVLLTLQLAFVSTIILLLAGTPLAWWLAMSRSRYTDVVSALVALPLVLPATVLGFYLLLLLGASGPGGTIAGLYGARSLAFSFEGLVIGSVIYSLPFVVQPIRNSFEAIDPLTFEVAATIGSGPWDRFFSVGLPLARSGFLTATILGFAHTIGEFGVVLMIGGGIPGETKVISIAIYEYVEALQWREAHILSGGMVLFALIVITAMMILERKTRQKDQSS